MPVINNISGIWNLGYDLGMGNYPIVMKDFTKDYSLSISNNTMLSASTESLIKRIGELSGKFTMTGPVLLGPVESQDSINFAYDLEMFYPACPRYYSSILAWDLWSRAYYPTMLESYFPVAMLESCSLDITDIANSTITWITDPLSEEYIPTAPGYIYLADGAYAMDVVPPMRSAAYYDFVALIDNYAINLKSFNFNYKIEYESFMPIGGSNIFTGLRFYMEEYMHTPVRFLKTQSATATIKLIAMSSAPSPWGIVVPWNAPEFGTSTQYHDTAMHESPYVDIVFMVSGRTALWDITPNYPIGTYIDNVSVHYQPGISDISANLNFVLTL